MTILEKFKKACETNRTNPLFAPLDDEYLGTRINGGFAKIIRDGGRVCQCFVFDNGEHFVYDIEENALYGAALFPQDWFIHKYLERIVYDFKEKYLSSLQEIDKDRNTTAPSVYVSQDEIRLQSNGVIRLLPYRNDKMVYLTNILLPMDLRGKGIGLKLISDIFVVCERLGYKFRLSQMVDSFYKRMVRRGANVITPFDEVEITSETQLGLVN